MRSDRVLVGNPAQLGHWNAGTELFFRHCVYGARPNF